MLPLHHTGILVDEARLELALPALQTGTLPLSYSSGLFVTDILIDSCFLIIEFIYNQTIPFSSQAEDSLSADRQGTSFFRFAVECIQPCLPAGHCGE
jgi:hypothetical protein